MYVHQIIVAMSVHDPEKNVISGHLIVVAVKSKEMSKPVLVMKIPLGTGDSGICGH